MIQFLYFFGLLFNFDKLTLRVKNDGCFLMKSEKGWFDPSTPWHLSIENPIDPKLDVGKASYHIKVAAQGGFEVAIPRVLLARVLLFELQPVACGGAEQPAERVFVEGIGSRHAALLGLFGREA